MEAGRPQRAEFDERMFEKELRALHALVEGGASKPPQDLSYTVFVLALLWLVVAAPFLTGAVLAFALGH